MSAVPLCRYKVICEQGLPIRREKEKMCNSEKTRHFHAGQARGSMPSKIHSMCTGGGHFPPFSCKVLFSLSSQRIMKREYFSSSLAL